jgi:hypothetical protein
MGTPITQELSTGKIVAPKIIRPTKFILLSITASNQQATLESIDDHPVTKGP